MIQHGRPRRVGELIRKEIAALLTKGLKDPRIGFVSVMAVRMSPDLNYANVYVSLYGSEKDRKSSLIALRNSAGWVRRELGKHLRTRVTPEVRFFADDTLDDVYRLEEVFDEIKEERKNMPMNPVELDEMAQELLKSNSFLLTSHANPDGDAVGSLLALYHFLRAAGKQEITCVLADPIPKIYQDLPGAGVIRLCEGDPPEYEAAVLLDVASLDRIGAVSQWVPRDKKILVLDHHREDSPDGTLGFIDPSYAAVGEIICELFTAAGRPMTLEAAHCAYVAQITDTGGFRYSNTNARSHRLAATMVDAGLDVAAICRHVFETISLPKFELLRLVLERRMLLAGGRIAFSYTTADDLREVDWKKEDLNGLVNFLRNIEGVEAGLLFHSPKPGATKVSMRAGNGFNAAEFLKTFGGGGHAAAAGATLEAPLEEARKEVLDALAAAMGEKA